jgi:hypothetical protein
MIGFIGTSLQLHLNITAHTLNDVCLTNLCEESLTALNLWLNWTKVKVKVTLRLTVSQSVSLGIEPHLRPMTRYLLLCHSYGLVLVGRPIWREVGSVFCMCCWSLPAQTRWRYTTPPPHGSVHTPSGQFSRPKLASRRAEQSRSLLPAISRHGHSWHRAPVGPVAIYLLLV